MPDPAVGLGADHLPLPDTRRGHFPMGRVPRELDLGLGPGLI
ncbi:hypothetical protein ACM25N_09515 [Roseovarius sp. C7]